MSENVRNVLIVALIALAVVAVPGVAALTSLVWALLTVAMVVAMAWFAYVMFKQNRGALGGLAGLSGRQRWLLYGAVAVALGVLVATPLFWSAGGVFTILWLVLLAGACFVGFRVWSETRRYT